MCTFVYMFLLLLLPSPFNVYIFSCFYRSSFLPTTLILSYSLFLHPPFISPFLPFFLLVFTFLFLFFQPSSLNNTRCYSLYDCTTTALRLSHSSQVTRPHGKQIKNSEQCFHNNKCSTFFGRRSFFVLIES